MSRIICTTAAEATAIAAYLNSEDQDACWLVCHRTRRPTVVTTADQDTVKAAVAFVEGV